MRLHAAFRKVPGCNGGRPVRPVNHWPEQWDLPAGATGSNTAKKPAKTAKPARSSLIPGTQPAGPGAQSPQGPPKAPPRPLNRGSCRPPPASAATTTTATAIVLQLPFFFFLGSNVSFSSLSILPQRAFFIPCTVSLQPLSLHACQLSRLSSASPVPNPSGPSTTPKRTHRTGSLTLPFFFSSSWPFPLCLCPKIHP